MKKVSIDGLLGLNLEEIEIVYRRCKGEKVENIANDMGIGESTIWNDRMPRILEMLGVESWKDAERELRVPLRKIIFSPSALKSGWPDAYREKIEALREVEETPASQSSEAKTTPAEPGSTIKSSTQSETNKIPSSTPLLNQNQSSPDSGRTRQVRAKPSVPSWVLIAIPLLVVCLIFLVGIRFVWSQLPQFSPFATQGITNTDIPTDAPATALSEPVVPATSTATAETSLTPTETMEPTATPSQLPTQTSIPTLFRDSFDTGVGPEWGMAGDNFNVVEGKLSSIGTLHGIVGSSSWTDYAVEFNLDHLLASYIEAGLRILVRYQNDSNYMALAIKSVNGCDFRWLVVSGGVERVVVGSETHIDRDHKQCFGLWRIEVAGNSYKVIQDFEPRLEFFDETFNSGGVGIFVNQETTEITIDEFKVLPLP